MRAMILDAAQLPLRLDADASTPKPGPGQVLIRVRACGVCRTDLHILDGELTNPKHAGVDMSMKAVFACILALLAATAQAAPYFRDGYDLQNRLLRQDPVALAYVVGVYDTIQITQYHASPTERFVCPPPAVTGTELVDAVKGYLQAEPRISIYPAALVVLRAFVWAFPCDKT
jgi:hypothetical protein